ncbi:MAG: hypothetical protein BGO69_07790 [Bacteroidetes bacterium 46-16]|mgnify:CR=1 FL=1|nr:MAG: hypothetical protein BGO69_07790 [Bacteroidetes bacterium 46-16]
MKKVFIPVVIIIFAILGIGSYMLHNTEPAYDFTVLLTGNVIMAALSLLTYFIVTGQLRKNPAAFVRGVSASTFIKLLVCMGGILTYVLVKQGKGIHKPSLFMLLGIYAVYTITETWLLSRYVRNTK